MGRLGQLLGEGRSEAEHAPAAADEVEAREVTGEHGRMTLGGSELDPDPEEQVRHDGRQSGGQDDRIALRPAAQEHSRRTLGGSPGRLSAQVGHVRGLEEPSFHGEAG